MKNYTPNNQDKINAQKEYCDKNNLPYLAPKNGLCYNCLQQIYMEIKFERAKNSLITGCPHCHRSFCD